MNRKREHEVHFLEERTMFLGKKKKAVAGGNVLEEITGTVEQVGSALSSSEEGVHQRRADYTEKNERIASVLALEGD